MGRDEADFLMGHLSARMDEINLMSSEVPEENIHSCSKK